MENKNYYDWLEISKKASPEVIEKAYKALVKKYHPDLQEGDKLEAEEILKKINEAYDVLSDEIKRAQYDATLQEDEISKEDYDKLKEELNNAIKNSRKNNQQYNYEPQQDLNYTNDLNQQYEHYAQENTYRNSIEQKKLEQQRKLKFEQEQLERQRQAQIAELEYQRQVEAARQKAYHDAYVQDLRNRGYKIRYKKTFKDYVRFAITIIVIILILIIAWHIPFVHNWLVSLYNDNEVIRFIVDGFSKIRAMKAGESDGEIYQKERGRFLRHF